ncbi:hypothetical protein LOZ07_000657 [Ophidiomyces ophidiicola]|uniref:uncharacterized protein n=1 Tax=Ophidiomyces ophidiicola TaxID=1387563 RepID=UPI0020C2F65E|nr:uncharacterized protein LOZ57_005293 [Ophidiomyces ophidiicola]KAI1942269.1 hypothetical protein LOZ57_005293 [Ophidiomyces ophidiicola]KAI1999045.1 hypothetical protein LOZ50_006618 [Ophidiomyces ophidiicola]KAI2025297.1 hypothetical protein LOZ45_003362 [Ophidiomyces ophidiicola]KAI2051905.1 hypothetical protein LOZ38_002448 [Ophidiomyces ophidiicola]KAI2065991.1 hypothetical protein LOZ37_006156 [Ophidiomyces ophidiicola]
MIQALEEKESKRGQSDDVGDLIAGLPLAACDPPPRRHECGPALHHAHCHVVQGIDVVDAVCGGDVEQVCDGLPSQLGVVAHDEFEKAGGQETGLGEVDDGDAALVVDDKVAVPHVAVAEDHGLEGQVTDSAGFLGHGEELRAGYLVSTGQTTRSTAGHTYQVQVVLELLDILVVARGFFFVKERMADQAVADGARAVRGRDGDADEFIEGQGHLGVDGVGVMGGVKQLAGGLAWNVFHDDVRAIVDGAGVEDGGSSDGGVAAAQLSMDEDLGRHFGPDDRAAVLDPEHGAVAREGEPHGEVARVLFGAKSEEFAGGGDVHAGRGVEAPVLLLEGHEMDVTE